MDAKTQDILHRMQSRVVAGVWRLDEIPQLIRLAYELGHVEGMRDGIAAIKSIREAA